MCCPKTRHESRRRCLCSANQPLWVFRGEVCGALKHARFAEASEARRPGSALWRDHDPLTAADAEPPSLDFHAELARLAVAIGRRRFDAEQVVGGRFAQDALECEVGRSDRDVDETASGRLGKVAQPVAEERPVARQSANCPGPSAMLDRPRVSCRCERCRPSRSPARPTGPSPGQCRRHRVVPSDRSLTSSPALTSTTALRPGIFSSARSRASRPPRLVWTCRSSWVASWMPSA